MRETYARRARFVPARGERRQLHEASHAERRNVRNRELAIRGGDSLFGFAGESERAERHPEVEERGGVHLEIAGEASCDDSGLERGAGDGGESAIGLQTSDIQE